MIGQTIAHYAILEKLAGVGASLIAVSAVLVFGLNVLATQPAEGKVTGWRLREE